MKLRGWEKGNPMQALLFFTENQARIPEQPAGKAAAKKKKKKKASHLHVLCYMTLIVRYDSGRFNPDILLKSFVGELISQALPDQARCFLLKSRAQEEMSSY